MNQRSNSRTLIYVPETGLFCQPKTPNGIFDGRAYKDLPQAINNKKLQQKLEKRNPCAAVLDETSRVHNHKG